MIRIKRKLVATLLFCSLPFGTTLAADELTHDHALAINSNEIYSITVTPNKAHGATNYTLKIYSYADQKKPSIKLTHSLRGQISNVDITDIDHDEKEELVIETTFDSSNAKFHRDIFELEETSLFNMIKQYFLKGKNWF